MYTVRIEQFEGPFDLLLEIIESKRLPLVQVSLAQVTDQFIEHVKAMQSPDIETLVQFLTVASRLALLKSRELVPAAFTSDETDGSVDALEKELALYRPFRRAARLLAVRLHRKHRLYERERFAATNWQFALPKRLAAKDLAAAADAVLGTVTLPQKIPQARMKERISLETCVAYLTNLVKKGERVDFLRAVSKKHREEKLVHFLGLLELVRTGTLRATQRHNFGTIVLAQ